jgi:diguanylate cyclase (GGDEF)-like protein/PAS domain S-box-containing protein
LRGYAARVNTTKQLATVLPRNLPVMAVLGLSNAGEADWSRLQGLQYSSLGKVTRLRIGAHGVAALAACKLFWGMVHPVMLLAWLLALGGALYMGARCDNALRDVDRRRITRQEVNEQTLIAAGTALAWAVPIAFFLPFVNGDARREFWAITTMLMTVSAIILPAAPLGTLMFGSVLGLASAAGFVSVGSFYMALISMMFVAVVGFGAVEAARNFLIAKLAEAGVAERNEVVSLLLREFEEGEADWLWQIDPARRVRSVSPRFAFALGRNPDEIDGKPLIQLVAGPAWYSGQFPPSLHDLAERLKRRESFSNLLVRVSINGSQRWWELSGTPKLDDNGNFDGFRGVGSDVTEQRESSDKIAYLARYDTLTGLPNRMMLTETLGEAMRYAEQWRTRCAFLMIDLDRFKAVNDTLGHLVGDQLLARVSERLKSLVTDNELCGRLGGDEFAIVIRDASDIERVNRVAEAMIDILSRPYEVDHHTLYVGASVGSAIGPRDGSTVETLMRNADLALYRSKDGGGGQHYTYEPSLHADAEERRRLEFALRHALERNEFHLMFQPVVDAKDEHVVSFEALLRWNNEEHGSVSPAKFVPLAEDTRLIVPIGEWVLREACKEATRWPSDVKVAVNVSGEQLLDPGLVQSLIGALAASRLPAQRLEIEVTESIFLRDPTTARATLEQIMELGCGIALDDFGTGYSSLAYIRNLRFSTIKVDRSFVQGAAVGSRESLAIIRAVVAMADSLEMSTTAEGVETEGELAVIRELGCRKVQGYFFGRPMSAADALALFANRDGRRTGAA